MWSNVRFSPTITITCLMRRSRAFARVSGLVLEALCSQPDIPLRVLVNSGLFET